MHQAADRDANGKALAYMLLGVSSGLGLDLCAKSLLTTYPLAQFVWLRSLIGLTIYLLLAAQFGGFRSLFTRRWPWHLLRTFFAAGAMFGFFYGLARLPLVDALTLGFTAPLMMTALSVPVLGEHVGWRRWLAVSVGFVGVLVILRPGVQAVSPAALACLFGALCYSCLGITARKLASTESSYALLVYVITGPLLISTALLGRGDWVTPDPRGWLLFFLAAACSVAAWIGLVGAYRRAAPALIAPFEYTALIGGAVAGYLIWGEVPDRWVVIGSMTIIASGLFVVLREFGGTADYALRRRRLPADPQSPPAIPVVNSPRH